MTEQKGKPEKDAFDCILAYHQRTKHRFDRYAPGPGYLDWATQPDPFRCYAGAPRLALSLAEASRDERPWYDDLYLPVDPLPLSRDTVSSLLFHSFALSAWKMAGGSRWPLRCHPSSGNLHPTEVYLLLGAVPELSESPLLVHYNAHFHGLELRGELSSEQRSQILQALPPETILVGFTSIHWRESWKYGERALRYCLLDLGHAYAALAYSAACLGWPCVLLPYVDTGSLARLFGVVDQQGPEAEQPDCVVAVCPKGWVDWRAVSRWHLSPEAAAIVRQAVRNDPPNRLSPSHRAWPVIDHACRSLSARHIDVSSPAKAEAGETGESRRLGARWVIRQRRSVQSMDGKTQMGFSDFSRMLHRLSRSGLPVEGLGCKPGIHLGVLVHRVEGLAPGVYFLARSERGLNRFQETSSEDWEWLGIDPTLSFFRLRAGDARPIAKVLSCHQDIASDGAFMISMLAEFESRMQQSVWEYVRLHMEAGALGQLLYLEAEAAGLRGTGIGCFFDDPVHELYGLSDRTFQALYHFTLGGGLEDSRLTTLDAYHHLETP